MDILFIEKLVVIAMIGIHDWEKTCFQKLIFDLELAYDKRQFKNYGVSSYLDYTRIRELIFNIVDKKHFLLIEDVAEMTAKVLLKHCFVSWVSVTVRKPSAIHNAVSAGIRIKRRNNEFYY